jgi:hypothetical protein|tara:strand:- start:128 stop:298 length:171 start_codon:yes stop_codon:yes gene_type:complete
LTSNNTICAVCAALEFLVNAGDFVAASRALFETNLYIVTDILPRLSVGTPIVGVNN